MSIPDVPKAERTCENCAEGPYLCPGGFCKNAFEWEESEDSFHDRVEWIVETLTRERDEALAALRLLWNADSGSREAYIDEPDDALTGDAQLLRDAWRAIRKALGEGD